MLNIHPSKEEDSHQFLDNGFLTLFELTGIILNLLLGFYSGKTLGPLHIGILPYPGPENLLFSEVQATCGPL